jgi:hypothetical protein
MKLMLAALIALSSFASMASDKICAVAYNSLDHDFTSKLVLKAGDAIYNLNKIDLENSHGDWDNKISKVVVKKGCSLIAYQYQNFNRSYNSGRPLNGYRVVFENTSQERNMKSFVLPYHLDNTISSVKCFCH